MKANLETYNPESRLRTPEELRELSTELGDGAVLLADMLAKANPDTIHDL